MKRPIAADLTMKTTAMFLAGGALLALLACGGGAPPPTGGGSVAPAELDVTGQPVQVMEPKPTVVTFSRHGYEWTLTRVAKYRVRAYVLGKENYHFDWNAELASCDLALAWGELMRDNLYRKIAWSQSGRWYWWKYDADFDRDPGVIIANSANTHLIPATATIATAVAEIEPGDRVELAGSLVTIAGKKDGQTYTWNTSLSRSDTGDGSCEILYLTKVIEGGRTTE